MNILIVGNGFDLSHYLPTKYDHFMDVMHAIEIHQGDSMTFDELFSKCREDWFINKTKEVYNTENITLEKEKLTEIKKLLERNYWYRYFKNHVQDIKTWIDFEQKINEGLKAISVFIEKINLKIEEIGYYSSHICHVGKCKKSQIFIRVEYCKILENLNILKSGYYRDASESDEHGRKFKIPYETHDDFDDYRFYIKDDINTYVSGYRKLDEYIILDNLQKSLHEFIEIFNLYLILIIDDLNTRNQLKIIDKDWLNPDHIYSFNYTNSFLRFYKLIDIDFLHGQLGENQNIVLGISELENESIKKMKAYGFTKYHQKLFKDTDYLFLDGYKNRIKTHLQKYEKHKITQYANNQIFQSFEKSLYESAKLNLDFSIWGHSLDVSDKDYIVDLFSLNDEIDRNVRVTLYYFNSSAKFSLLNNLLAILGKDKLECWMKNKWLEFKENPRIDFGIEIKDKLIQEAS